MTSRWGVTDSRRAVGRYLGSIAAVAAAVLLRSAFDPVLHNRLPFATVVATVAGIVWFAGLGPGIVAAVLGYVWADWLFVSPRYTVGISSFNDVMRFAGYGVVTVSIVAFGQLARRARRLAEERAGEAERARATVADALAAQKRLEANLRETSHKLQVITDGMTASVTRCTRDLRYAWVSRSYAEWLHRTPEEVVGRPIAEVVGREAFEELLPEFERVLRGVPVRYEKEVVFAGLGPRWIQATYTPTFDASGAADGWVAVVHDIDELRRAEEGLKELDRRKDEFLALLGHELRNPLAPIHNAVDLLERVGSDAPPAREARAIIRRQTAHITRLLDDLLDLSRIARGKIALRKQRCDLGRIVRETVDDYQAVLLDAGLALRLGMPPEPVWVDGDPARLSQILGNLLHNSRKFTPPGGEILVTVGRSSSGMAEVEVRDTGVGIPRRVLERIFEPFVQADDNLDRGSGGLGLGLSLVKGIVDLHGGEVSVESGGSGQGSRFWIRLPVSVAAPEPEALVDVPTRTGAPVRVLVIEDHADTASTLRMLLELSGHEAASAGSGAAGLEAARRLCPDVVFCDIGLPGMDGYAVARALRNDPRLCGAYLVALTGYGQERDRRLARDAGFDLHLTKPINFSVVEQTLAQARAGHREQDVSGRV